jgi:hypothetical protein
LAATEQTKAHGEPWAFVGGGEARLRVSGFISACFLALALPWAQQLDAALARSGTQRPDAMLEQDVVLEPGGMQEQDGMRALPQREPREQVGTQPSALPLAVLQLLVRPWALTQPSA